MKKLALSFLASTLIAGAAVAGGCDYHQEVTMASNKPVLMFQIDDMKLMKYTSSNGTILYIIQNIEGETVAKDLNQNQLASRYPEMAEKLEGSLSTRALPGLLHSMSGLTCHLLLLFRSPS